MWKEQELNRLKIEQALREAEHARLVASLAPDSAASPQPRMLAARLREALNSTVMSRSAATAERLPATPAYDA